MYISKSSLNTFLMCPRKFQHVYLEKIKSETSPEAQRGIDVHEFCRDFYDNLTFHNGTFSVDTEFLEGYMDAVMPDAKPQIENVINFEKNRWDVCKAMCPKNPKKLFIPLLRESKFFSESLQQVTIIDRLDSRIDGNYTLIEYKTERYQNKDWKKTELRREVCFEKSTLEGSPEFSKAFPNDIMDFVVYFPRSNDVMIEKFNYRSARAMQNAIEKMRNSIDLQSFPCNVQYHCRFCPFNLECPMEM